MDEALGRATMAKVTRRLIPFMFTLYIFNYLDRVNVSVAGLTFKQDLHLSDSAFGFGMGLFFIGYFFFEIPSNLVMERVGARRWIARIMISWGVIASAMMFVHTAIWFYVLRFLLGVAEAGFFPGMVLYLTYWFPTAGRARAAAKFMVATTVSGLIGGPLGGLLLKMNGIGGLKGWQWLFLLEGIPSFLLGFATLWYLTDRPAKAHWLLPEERAWLEGKMEKEEAQRKLRHDFTLFQALRHEKVVRLAALFLMMALCGYGVGLWTPLLLKARSDGWSDQKVLWLLTIPGLLGVVSMLVSGAHSDRKNERRLHLTFGLLLNAVGIALVAVAPTAELTLLALCVGAIGGAIANAPFWAISTSFLSGTAAAGGIAFINSVGNLGGFFGPTIMGELKQRTGNYQMGLLILAVVLACASLFASRLPHDRVQRKEATEETPVAPAPEPETLTPV